MRAYFVFEKFIEDSDPIADMGIGILQQIKDWIKTLNLWSNPDVNNKQEILELCISHGRENPNADTFIDYLISNYNHEISNKDEILRLLLSYHKHQFIDTLLEQGAEFQTLEDKAFYILEIKGKAVSFTPEEKLTVACKAGKFNLFLKCIKSGMKVKIGLINSLFQKPWLYRDFYSSKGQEQIIKYLQDNINNLEEIIHPRDHKKIDKIKTFLEAKISKGTRDYPRGYKIYRLLKFIDENKVVSRKEIVKFLFDISHGEDTFNPLTDSSYWSDNFRTIVYPNLSSRSTVDDTFVLNSHGKAKLQKLDNRFKGMKISPAPYI